MNNFVKKSGIYLYIGAPHQTLDKDFSADVILKKDKKALAVIWSTDFDIKEELPWWYCILDHTFSLNEIKSKRRAEIRKACSKFIIKRIDPKEYADQLGSITYEAWQNYPQSYRPTRTAKDMSKIYCNHAIDKCQAYWGCFDVETEELVGFANCYIHKDWVEFRSLKTSERCKENGGALAIVCKLCEEYMQKSNGIQYICDGQRNIVHQTHFQEFLVTKFGWRYAWTRLNICYQPWVGVAVFLLYPFRRLLLKSKMGYLQKIGILLRYEEIARKCKLAKQ